jgi:hypothetical protein
VSVSRALRRLSGREDLGLEGGGTHPVVPPPPPYLAPKRFAKPVYLPPMVGAPGEAQKKLLEAAVAVFVIDDSGSLYFGSSGDLTGIRYAAPLSLLGLMRRGGGGRAGVVHYGSEAPAALATPLLDVRRDRRQLQDALSIPTPSLGGTNVASGFARCAELLAEDPSGQAVVYLIGDGLEAISPSARQAIAALPPRSVHLLLVDRSGSCDAALEAGWRSLPLGSIHRLDVFDTKAMAWQLAEIFASSIGLQMPSAAGPEKARVRR